VIPVDNILFASEMIGAVRGIDPETGFYYDDTGATSRPHRTCPPSIAPGFTKAMRAACTRAWTRR